MPYLYWMPDIVFLLLAKLDSAEHYTLQGLRMAELIDSKEEKQTAVRNLGIIYSERKEYQKAWDYYYR